MPSLVAHHHFAVMVEQAAEPDLAFADAQSPLTYRWGAQGPDILFYHNAPFGSRTALLGRQMHNEKIAECFTGLTQTAAQMKSVSALSYILGFCTHYCLDRRLHPFIENIIQTRMQTEAFAEYDKDARHRLCEADLDAAVIEQYISSEQSSFEAYRLLDPLSPAARLIGKLLTEAGQNVYQIGTSPSRVESAMRTMRTAHTLLHTTSEGARAQIASVERLFGKPGLLTTMMRPLHRLPIDCTNASHQIWHKENMPQVDRTDSFFDLFEGSIPSALSLQRAVYNCYYQSTPINPMFFPADYNGTPLSEK